MKRILYLHQYFNTPDSKGGTRSYDLSQVYIKNNYKVIVVTARSKIPKELIKNQEKLWNKINIDDIEVHALNLDVSNKNSFIKRKIAFLKFAILATLKVLTIKSDILIATSTPLTISIPALFYHFIRRKPFIFEVRDVWPELPIAIGALKNPLVIRLFKYLEYLSYKHSMKIIALSTDMEKSITNRYPQYASKIEVIPNISHIDRYQNLKLNPISPIQIPRDQPFIVYIGTFGFINDVSYAVKLAVAAKKQECNFNIVLIGDGQERNLLSQVEHYKDVINHNLFIFDRIKKNETPAVLKLATATLILFKDIPEMAANSANKFFDSLAASTPPIINYGGWQRLLLKKYNFGLTLPTGRTNNEIKHAALLINNYVNNKELIKEHSYSAYRIAKKKFSIEIAGNKYLSSIKNSII